MWGAYYVPKMYNISQGHLINFTYFIIVHILERLIFLKFCGLTLKSINFLQGSFSNTAQESGSNPGLLYNKIIVYL